MDKISLPYLSKNNFSRRVCIVRNILLLERYSTLYLATRATHKIRSIKVFSIEALGCRVGLEIHHNKMCSK